jgi:hypothetical protein
MPITFDAATTTSYVTNTSKTFSHTCSTGSDRILFVGALTGGGDIVTGATYGGDAMTLIAKIALSGGTSNVIYLFYKIAPKTGANNVVISQSSSAFLDGVACSYTGAEQANQPDGSATNSTTSITSLSASVTTSDDNCWSVAIGRSGGNQVVSAGSGSYKRANATYIPMFDSNADLTPTGSKTMTITQPTSGNMSMVMATFSPAGGDPPPPTSTFIPKVIMF